MILVYNIYIISLYAWNSYANEKIKDELLSQRKDNPVEESKVENLEKFEPLLKINEDIVGWVQVPNTKVNYPVVKTTDNDFYLHHNIKKEKSVAGSIFMDYRNNENVEDRNTIIYGHNMKDGSMFKDLVNYKKQEFLKENQTIEFSNLKDEMQWMIFSVYITDTNFNYIRTKFVDDEDYERFLNEISSKSMYDTQTNVSKEDQIVTLSTCTYEFKNARLAIHAKRVK